MSREIQKMARKTFGYAEKHVTLQNKVLRSQAAQRNKNKPVCFIMLSACADFENTETG